LAAQKEWGDGIVRISKVKLDNGDFKKAAEDHINALYGYGLGTVLFKPTLAKDKQFRDTFKGALSYFVAGDNAFPEDTGFAINGWKAVRWDMNKVIVAGATATAMGNYFFTAQDDMETKVEYSFGYFLDAQGKVRINLHHSSMPYTR
jgi:hypothetical protein